MDVVFWTIFRVILVFFYKLEYSVLLICIFH